MRRRQWVLAAVVVLGCLAIVTTELAAGKPPKPTPTPTPTPTPAPPHTIAYVQLNGKNTQDRPLMLVKEDGSGGVKLYGGDGLQVAEPAWSPDGQWIAFNSRDTTTGEMWLNLIRPDGTDLTRIAPRCSCDCGMTRARVQGPSWQPVDPERDGTLWLVYRDGTLPGGDPGVDCDPNTVGHLIWAVEIDFNLSPEQPLPVATRIVHLPSPEPYPWKGYQAVWSSDGFHLAAIQWPEVSGVQEIIVFDVWFDQDGLPKLVNPWSLTPDPNNLKGQLIKDIALANWSNTLIVSADAAVTDPADIWMCEVDFGTKTCAGGWTNLTPGNAFDLLGACFSSDDSEILVSLRHDGPNNQPVADLVVGPFVPFAPLDLRLLVPAPRFMYLIQPDWRAMPAP